LNKNQYIFTILSLLIFFAGCAKIGSPTGGPKDETPPKVVRSVPENYSTNFDNKRIEVEFDEFIQLKNINQELVVSPPQKDKPVVRLRNKVMLIDLQEELIDSTTYTLNFGQAIVDNNESNMLENYLFVFSTGSYIDSLGVSGKIVNAFDLKPSEDPVTIMLYDKFYDSVPYLEIPAYIGKSNKKGYFEVNNLKSDTFKVFALKDKNYNLIYDLPDEEIAFLDTNLVLSAEYIMTFLDSGKILQDSLGNDSLISIATDTIAEARKDTLLQDTVAVDTITFPKRKKYYLSIEMSLFKEDNKPQYMSGSSRKNRKRLDFYFNRPVTDTMYMEPLNFTPDSNWYILEKNLTGDTLFYWIKDSLIFKQDTLKMHLRYLVTDSILNYIPRDDTVNLNYLTEPAKTRRKQETGKTTSENLKIEMALQAGAILDLYKGISLVPENPVLDIDLSRIKLYKKVDTLEYLQKFTLEKDSLLMRKYLLKHEWEEIESYRLFIVSGAFTDIYGLTNDTINIPFKTQSIDHYGKLILTLTDNDQNLIVQLMTEKDRVIRTDTTSRSGPVVFPWLEPGKYKLKVIFDKNGNGKWDTGRYLAGIQPEKVKFYQGEINIRANWDLELPWDLKSEAIPSK
jgi:hypothetical protein